MKKKSTDLSYRTHKKKKKKTHFGIPTCNLAQDTLVFHILYIQVRYVVTFRESSGLYYPETFRSLFEVLFIFVI